MSHGMATFPSYDDDREEFETRFRQVAMRVAEGACGVCGASLERVLDSHGREVGRCPVGTRADREYLSWVERRDGETYLHEAFTRDATITVAAAVNSVDAKGEE